VVVPAQVVASFASLESCSTLASLPSFRAITALCASLPTWWRVDLGHRASRVQRAARLR
jgi:hypothetical protein